MADALPEFVLNFTRAIVGLRLSVVRVEGAWKMVQHRSGADRSGVTAGLEASEHGKSIANVMRRLEDAPGGVTFAHYLRLSRPIAGTARAAEGAPAP